MKRIISLILVCLSLLSFSACGKEEKERKPVEQPSSDIASSNGLASSATDIPSSENTSSIDLEQVYEEANDTLEEMHRITLETICEQIRPNTTYTVMGDGSVVFMLPIEGDVSVESLTEAYNAIYDYAPAFSVVYSATGAKKFVFRISDNRGLMVFESSIDYSSESGEVDFAFNPEYSDIVQQLVDSKLN